MPENTSFSKKDCWKFRNSCKSLAKTVACRGYCERITENMSLTHQEAEI